MNILFTDYDMKLSNSVDNTLQLSNGDATGKITTSSKLTFHNPLFEPKISQDFPKITSSKCTVSQPLINTADLKLNNTVITTTSTINLINGNVTVQSAT